VERIRSEGENPPYVSHRFPDEDLSLLTTVETSYLFMITLNRKKISCIFGKLENRVYMKPFV
jgi:hypothetical protein